MEYIGIYQELKTCLGSEPTKQPVELEVTLCFLGLGACLIGPPGALGPGWPGATCAVPGGQMVSSPTEACGWMADT